MASAFLLLVAASSVSARSLWSSRPVNALRIIQEAYTIGNGQLAALPAGAPGRDVLTLNVDSLWTGGLFENASYTGGNDGEKYQFLPGIRDQIWRNGTGDVRPLFGDTEGYGSYTVLGNLSVSLAGINSTSNYKRSLDLKTGVHTTTYTAGKANITVINYCSFPDAACVYSLASTIELPDITIDLRNSLVSSKITKTSCDARSVRLRGVTQAGPPEGMRYDSIAKLSGKLTGVCNNITGTLVISPKNKIRSFSLVLGAGTNYDQTHGTAAYNYSFKGEDPGLRVQQTVAKAASKSEASLRSAHVRDYSSLAGAFSLDLPDTLNSEGKELSTLIGAYYKSGTETDNLHSDPYLESLLFDYGRHLFISSSRDGSLPPNLQGRWSEGVGAAWSGDYHIDINLEMNHWGVPETGLQPLQNPLWDFMLNTWVPRGTDTAQLLYGANTTKAWVTHSEMNIFGHTAMKNGEPRWVAYPIEAAWMMQHVYDNWEYSHDKNWLQKQGWPLISGVAEFWLTQLQDDKWFNDSSLVVNPCNSPEQDGTTFGCTHWQQLIHQVFTDVVKLAPEVSASSSELVRKIQVALPRLDKGLHIGSWGQVKEYKIQESYGLDNQNNTHRHLSHLVGWYPGYSISSYLNGTSNSTIQKAVEIALIDRGVGFVDSNAGWEKSWRGACWARLKNAEQAYFQIRYVIGQNFALNGLSMYSGGNGNEPSPPFQIDANFGLVGNTVAMLVTDLPQDIGDSSTKTVLLGPAIPTQWAGGSVKGLRLRGGGSVDFSWDDNGVVHKVKLSGRTLPLKIVNVEGGTILKA